MNSVTTTQTRTQSSASQAVTVIVTLPATSTPTSGASPPSTASKPIGAIVGGVIGGVLVLLAITALTMYMRKRRQNPEGIPSLAPQVERKLLVEPLGNAGLPKGSEPDGGSTPSTAKLRYYASPLSSIFRRIFLVLCHTYSFYGYLNP